jgi:lipopolysaccharide transport protein LptA
MKPRPPPSLVPRPHALLALAGLVALSPLRAAPLPPRGAAKSPPRAAQPTAALPVHISSDTMTLTRLPLKGGKVVERNVYQGHVIIRQGPITLWAETATLRLNAHGLLLSARAEGHPARFTRLARRGPPIQGTSLVVTYDPATTTYTLLDKVHVRRGPQLIVAHEITYNTTTGILVAHRGRRHRIRMVLPPHPGRP